jgi:hypothetical protein
MVASWRLVGSREPPRGEPEKEFIHSSSNPMAFRSGWYRIERSNPSNSIDAPENRDRGKKMRILMPDGFPDVGI